MAKRLLKFEAIARFAVAPSLRVLFLAVRAVGALRRRRYADENVFYSLPPKVVPFTPTLAPFAVVVVFVPFVVARFAVKNLVPPVVLFLVRPRP